LSQKYLLNPPPKFLSIKINKSDAIRPEEINKLINKRLLNGKLIQKRPERSKKNGLETDPPVSRPKIRTN